jgi:hypothetical protein
MQEPSEWLDFAGARKQSSNLCSKECQRSGAWIKARLNSQNAPVAILVASKLLRHRLRPDDQP